MIVVDSSAILPHVFRDEDQSGVLDLAAAMSTDFSAAPWIFWFEVRNILVYSEKRGRISPQDSELFLDMIADAKIGLDDEPDEAAVLDYARAHGLTVYDAAYLELAVRTSAVLATRDKALIATAQKLNVPLFNPLIK